jgi:hypothetical protein
VERRPNWAVPAAILCVVLLGVPIGLVSIFPSTVRASCVPGQTVAEMNHTLTPELLLNSPYLGSASGTFHAHDDPTLGNRSLTIPATNGDVWGSFEDYRWVISQGIPNGAGVHCSDILFASATHNGGGGESSTAGGLRNDSHEPNESGGDGSYAVLGYNNSYSSETSIISTCGTGGVVRSVRSNHVDVRLYFQLNGTSKNLLVPFETSTNYTYFFPANTGIWRVDNLSAPGGPGGGWAFSYSPCPP